MQLSDEHSRITEYGTDMTCRNVRRQIPTNNSQNPGITKAANFNFNMCSVGIVRSRTKDTEFSLV